MARKLAKRQSIGTNEPANDNQPWPLAAQLRREGNEVLLAVAERYRSVYDAATYEPQLVGREPDNDMVLDVRQVTKTDGTVAYKGVRVERLKRHEAANDNEVITFPPREPRRHPQKWVGDAGLIAHIDGTYILSRLRIALGPLVECFDDAVLHGRTLTAIGQDNGLNSVASGPGAKLLVMLGLEAVQKELSQIDREDK